MNKKRIFTTPQVEVEVIERIKEIGRKISHNPHISFNEALHTILGEFESLRMDTSGSAKRTGIHAAETGKVK